METLYDGYIETRYGRGVQTLELHRDKGFIYAYVNGDLADDVETVEEFAANYGTSIYRSLKDYQDTVSENIYDYWKES